MTVNNVNPSDRRLAAIMFTDVVGSTAIMSENEELTINNVKRDLQLMKQICNEFHGEVIKTMGDGTLAVFDSAVHAVECAQEIQKQFAINNDKLNEEERLLHRIGLHLGDIYSIDDDIMGDGVNIASRIESTAPAGGIALSEAIYQVVKSRMNLNTRYNGPQKLKNVKDDIHTYSLHSLNDNQTNQHEATKPKKSYNYKKIIKIIFSIILIIIVAALFIGNVQKDKRIKKLQNLPEPDFINNSIGDINHKLPKILNKFDKNKDNIISKEEVPERAWRKISRADFDQNGEVSTSEFFKAKDKLKQLKN